MDGQSEGAHRRQGGRTRENMGDSDDVGTSEMPSERASGASTSEHPPSPAPKLNLAMSHFEVIEELGDGSFSEVLPVSYTHLTLPTKRIV